jgi:hypothetical protein
LKAPDRQRRWRREVLNGFSVVEQLTRLCAHFGCSSNTNCAAVACSTGEYIVCSCTVAAGGGVGAGVHSCATTTACFFYGCTHFCENIGIAHYTHITSALKQAQVIKQVLTSIFSSKKIIIIVIFVKSWF